MKGFVKVIIAGAVILGIGIAVLLIALGASGWNIDKAFGGSEFEMKTYSAQSDIDTVKIEFNAGQLEVVFYEGDKVKVDYPENNKYTSEITEENGKLSIVNKRQHWYDWIGCNTAFPTATVSLPAGSKVNLDLQMNAGTVSVAGGEYGNAKIYVNAGKIDIGEINCTEFDLELNAGAAEVAKTVCASLKLKMNAGTAELDAIYCNDIYTKINAGNMDLEIAGRESDYSISIERNAGSCNKSDRVGSDPDKKIYGKINAGSLDIEFTN